MKKYITIIFFFFIILLNSKVDALEYLPIDYNVIRYDQKVINNGDRTTCSKTDTDTDTGTTIWWAKIPAKYRMHYAYGTDVIGGKEKPSANAKRHNATLAINAQYMGLADFDGELLAKGTDVSKYDFYMKPNTIDSSSYANLYATKKTDTNIGINLAYAIDPKWCSGMCFMQIIKDGVNVSTYDLERYNNSLSDPTKNECLGAWRHPRTWIAIDSEGNQYIAVSAGRNEPLNGNDFSLPQAGLNYDEIIDVTKKYFTTDIKYLFNVDGGGSSAFVYKGEMLNPKYDDSENRYTVERQVRGIFYWKVDNYNITYDLDGGKLENNNENPKVYNIDSSPVKLNNPKKEGYEFVGWSEVIDGITSQEVGVDVTIDSTKIGDRSYKAIYRRLDDNKIIENVKVEDTAINSHKFLIVFGTIMFFISLTVFLFAFKKYTKN